MRFGIAALLLAVCVETALTACGGLNTESAPFHPGGGGGGQPGGSSDAGYFKDVLTAGGVPTSSSVTVEGWIAEHDFPMPAPDCSITLCLEALLGVGRTPDAPDPKTIIELGLTTPMDPSTFQRAPLNLTVVLDVSGSMADANKLGYAKEGIDLLIAGLTSSDVFGLVTFSDSESVVVPAAPVTDKSALTAAVDALQPESSTNLYAGLIAGYQQVQSHFDAARVNRVVLLTDGLQNMGVTDDATIEHDSKVWNDEGYGLTTIGVGLDVNQALLLALAQQGNGNYYFLQDESKVQQVFVQELDFLVSVMARQLVLELTPSDDYQALAVYGAPGATIATNGTVTIAVDTVFYSAKPGTIVVALQPKDGHSAQGPVKVGMGTYSYLPASGGPAESGTMDVDYPGPIPYQSNGEFFSHASVRKALVEVSEVLAFHRASDVFWLTSDQTGAEAVLDTAKTFVLAHQGVLADPEVQDDLGWIDLFRANVAASTPP